MKHIGTHLVKNSVVDDALILVSKMQQDPLKHWLWVSENRDAWVLGAPGRQMYEIDRIIDTDVADFLIWSWIITAPPGGCTPDNLEKMCRQEKDVQIALGTQKQMTGHYRLWHTYFPQPHGHFRTANDFSPAERTQGIANHRHMCFNCWDIQEFLTGLSTLEYWRKWVPLKCHKYLKESDTIVPSKQ